MNILFLTLAYPEGDNSRGIYIDLMKELKSRGNNVTVVTPIERRFKKDTYLKESQGINVLRVKTGNIQKTNLIEKGLSTVLIESQFISAIKSHLNNTKFDVIMYSTPPITFEKVIKYIKNRDNAKSYLLLKDIFPQNAVDIGMMTSGGMLYKYFRNKEKHLYKISDVIGCMSAMNKEYLLKNNDFLESNKIEICPNSILPLPYENISKEEQDKIRNKYKIREDALVLVYGGNLGKPQGIDFLINILESNKTKVDIYFLIVGSGTEYNKLNLWFEENKPNNAALYSLLPKEEYDNLVKACDIGLILLDSRFTIPNFPSRMLSYMEVGIPVIAATDRNTDVGEVIENGNYGYWCESEDIKGFNSIIDKITEDKSILESMGKNSRMYLEKNYTVKESADILLKNFD